MTVEKAIPTHRMLRGKVYLTVGSDFTKFNEGDQIVLTKDQAKRFVAKGWAEPINLEVTEKPKAKAKAKAKAKDGEKPPAKVEGTISK